eukprot:CAMPEP_0196723268 /NCGR_PEP_ID=MMETSP1091-20130531/5416_1 /TAXON_ID=302021 /ORGANISM="Rhodomonas sp., Strain CCMP768" /LENGTH=400 /DNA_ID=CAMNT_0042065139 /DNA_START=27 /DNA_END=1229 /DNA_ORIENTATION=+
MPWLVRMGPDDLRAIENENQKLKETTPILRKSKLPKTGRSRFEIQIATSTSTWEFQKGSPACDVAASLATCVTSLLNIVCQYFCGQFLPNLNFRIVFEPRTKKIIHGDVKPGKLPDYEFKDDPEQDARLEAQFAQTRKILYMNQFDDVLDDDNTVDGFFGSRIGVFGPDPFAWSFSNEEMARQHVPDLVPDIISFQKARKLRPFFDAWHDEVLACGDGENGEEEEDRCSRPPLPTLMSFRGSVQLQRAQGTGEVLNDFPKKGLSVVVEDPRLDPQALRAHWREQITRTNSGSMPNLRPQRHRALVVDESEAVTVARKHWQEVKFNGTTRDLMGLVSQASLRPAPPDAKPIRERGLRREELVARFEEDLEGPCLSRTGSASFRFARECVKDKPPSARHVDF